MLRFSPTAWAKLLFLRDQGDTEVTGFAIAAAEDLLLVEDICLVPQTCMSASVAMDDQAVADFFDEQVDRGLKPGQFARIWVHTHPGNWSQPSSIDEETFWRVFGRTDWAVMFILARGGQNYARLQFHVGPGGDMDIPISVDYRRPFAASNHQAWKEEYLAGVHQEVLVMPREVNAAGSLAKQGHAVPFGADADWFDWQMELFGDPDDFQEFQHAVKP